MTQDDRDDLLCCIAAALCRLLIRHGETSMANEMWLLLEKIRPDLTKEESPS